MLINNCCNIGAIITVIINYITYTVDIIHIYTANLLVLYIEKICESITRLLRQDV